jgi:hypothetical protein
MSHMARLSVHDRRAHLVPACQVNSVALTCPAVPHSMPEWSPGNRQRQATDERARYAGIAGAAIFSAACRGDFAKGSFPGRSIPHCDLLGTRRCHPVPPGLTPDPLFPDPNRPARPAGPPGPVGLAGAALPEPGPGRRAKSPRPAPGQLPIHTSSLVHPASPARSRPTSPTRSARRERCSSYLLTQLRTTPPMPDHSQTPDGPPRGSQTAG